MDNINPITKKTKNIVTAIYMVTEYIKVNDPIRNELRTSSISILKDVNYIRHLSNIDHKTLLNDVHEKFSLVTDLVHIARDIGFVSRMNATILDTEITLLQKYIQSYIHQTTIEDNLLSSIRFPDQLFADHLPNPTTNNKSQGFLQNSVSTNFYKNKQNVFHKQTNIAIKDNQGHLVKSVYTSNHEKHTDRKARIMDMVRGRKNSVTGESSVMIKDITHAFPDISEKTIQRELADLVATGVLKKIGEKRWSKYTIVPTIASRNVL
ncbi:MAG: hypothetical protein ACR2IQ_00470 [Minisyncoccia bacterium]